MVTGIITSQIGRFGFSICSAACPLMLPLFGCCFSWSLFPHLNCPTLLLILFPSPLGFSMMPWLVGLPLFLLSRPQLMIGRLSKESGTIFRLKLPLTISSTLLQMIALMQGYWQSLLQSQVRGFMLYPSPL